MDEDRIITLTLNPAVDRVLEVRGFELNSHTRARRIGHYPAGKGVNLSRVLATLGVRSVCTGFVGYKELGMFEEFLERVGDRRVTTQLLVIRDRTRDNTTIIDPINETETHLTDIGFTVQREDVRRILSKVSMLAREGATLCIAGSLPPGLLVGDFRSLVIRAQEAGAKVVIDTSAPVLQHLSGERFWMLKANAAELAVISGMPTSTPQQRIEAARSIQIDRGGTIEWVVATAGADGIFIVGPGGIEITGHVPIHPGLIISTVGCGDALLAGLLAGRAMDTSWLESAKLGLAAATANATSTEAGALDMESVAFYRSIAEVSQTHQPAPAVQAE